MNDLLIKFIAYLNSEEDKPSKATIKNYRADIGQFIRWYEDHFKEQFNPNLVTPQITQLYKQQNQRLSARSIERHLSSLRKFFHFLKADGSILISPFELNAKHYTPDADPWRLKDFKNNLYIYNSSHLTIKNYLIDVKQFMKWLEEVSGVKEAWHVSEKNIFDKINENTIEEYKSRLFSNGMAANSINRKLSSLRKYLAWAMEEGLVSRTFEMRSAKLETNSRNPDFKESKIQDQEYPTSNINKSEYSNFPPIRLFQKVTKGINLIFDTAVISPLTKTALSVQDSVWRIKGKPVFETENSKLSLSGNPSFNFKNVSKEFYAPLSISTKYFPLHKKAWFSLRYSRPNWYKKYHSYSITSYFHLAILVIFMSIIGFGLYQTFIQDTAKQKPALAGSPTAPLKILSFQGRLTDASDTPISGSRLMRFVIYNDPTATGAARLWEEVDRVTTDEDGIFSILLGSDGAGGNAALCNGESPPASPATTACGIPQSLFGQNSILYLGVTVEADSELAPRQQLATVAYATNAELLQGLPPVTDAAWITGATNTNAVLALNSSGTVSIGGTAVTTFQATGGEFKIIGQPVTIVTNVGSNGNIVISPDGIGKIELQKPITNSTLTGNFVPGAVEINDTLAVISTDSARATLIVNNNTASGDIFSASASGATKFTIINDGTASTSGALTFNNNSAVHYINSLWNQPLSFRTSPGGDAGLLDRLYIDKTGYVGIGTTAPTSKLYIKDTSTIPLYVESTAGNSYMSYKSAGGTGYFGVLSDGATFIQSTGNKDVQIWGASEIMRLKSSGNVGIGITSPTAGLHVKSGQSYVSKFESTGADNWNAFISTSGQGEYGIWNDNLYFQALNTLQGIYLTNNAGTAGLYIKESNGNVGIGTTSPLELLDVAGNATVSGNLTFYGGVRSIGTTSNLALTLGGATSGNILLSPSNNAAGGYLAPATDSNTDLGTSVNYFRNLYVDNIYGAGVMGYWQRNSQALSPVNVTDDILLGSTATSSALIKLTGTNRAGANYSWFNAGNVGIGITTPLATLDVTGTGRFSQALAANGGITFDAATDTVGAFTAAGTIDMNSNIITNIGSTGTDFGSAGQLTITIDEAVTALTVDGGLAQESTLFLVNDNLSPVFMIADAGVITAWANINANGGLDVDDAFVVADGGKVTVLDISDADIALTGATTNFAVTGDFTINTDDLYILKSSGNVGIGASVPRLKLQVDGTSGEPANDPALSVGSLRLRGTNNIVLDFGNIGDPIYGNWIQSRNEDFAGLWSPLLLNPKGGNVGIGTTLPTSKLQINGDVTPDSNGDHNLGSSTLFWGTVYANNFITPVGAGIGAWWQRSSLATLSPVNATDDVLIGGTATSSALIKLTGTNVAGANSSWFNAGYVGIGTTSPLAALDITGSASVSANIYMDGAYGTAHTYNILNNGSLDFRRSVGGDETTTTALYIGNNNYVGIGTTAPGSSLDVFSTTTNPQVRIGYSSSAYMTFGHGSSNAYITSNVGDIRISPASNVILTPSTGNVGIGTTSPNSKLTLSGTSGSYTAGPHLWVYTTEDAYPAFQQLNWSHDDIALSFDSYYNGTDWISTDAGSNYQIYKTSDLLQFRYGSGIAQGNTITYTAGLVLNNSGNVGIGTTAPLSKLQIAGNVTASTGSTYDLGAAGNTWRNLYVDNIIGAGVLGYWQRAGALGALSPSEITDDLLLGGTATSSALIKLTGTNVAGANASWFKVGNVGIGTTSPEAKLDVNAVGIDNYSWQMKVYSTAGSSYGLKVTNGYYLNTVPIFQASALDAGLVEIPRFVINANGNVGIGTTAPEQLLDVAGIIKSGTGAIYLQRNLTDLSTRRNWGWVTETATAGDVALLESTANNTNPSVARITIQSGGNLGIGTTSPVRLLELSRSGTGFEGIGIINDNGGTGSAAGIALSTDGGYNGGLYQASSTYNALANAAGMLILNAGATTNGIMIRSGLSTKPIVFVNGTESMRIVNGNVGIGTTAPTTILDIVGASSAYGIRSISTTALGATSGGGFNAVTSLTPTAADQRLGLYSFGSFNGTDYYTPVTISGYSDEAWSSTNLGGYMTFATTSIGTTARTERMRITSSGNVGLGTTNPTGLLHVMDPIAGADLMKIATVSSTFSNPASFEAAGDVSIAYDLQFTNQTASYIKSNGPLYIEAGESFESNDINFTTYGTGGDYFNGTSGNFYVLPNATWGTYAGIQSTTGKEAQFNVGNSSGYWGLWMPVSDNSLYFYDGTDKRVTFKNGGNVGIGTTAPGALMHLNGANVNYRGQLSIQSTDYAQITFYQGATTQTHLGAQIYYDVGVDDLVLTNYNNATGGDMIFSTKASSGESMRINVNGNVGIGTTAPTSPLEIRSNLAPVAWGGGAGYDRKFGYLSWGTSPRDYASIIGQTDVAILVNNASSAIAAMRIKNDGNVGIGTTAPMADLHVGTTPTRYSDISSTAIIGTSVAGTAYPLTLANTDTQTIGDQNLMTFDFGTTWSSTAYVGARIDDVSSARTSLVFGTYAPSTLSEKVRINSDGNVGIGVTNPTYRVQLPNVANNTGQGQANSWPTYSSIRWKENIAPMNNALDKISLLNPVYFDWKPENGGTHSLGFIAEEVGRVFPQLVSWETDGVYASSLDYSKMVAIAIKGIQEQSRQIGILDEKISSGQSQIQNLGDAVATVSASNTAIVTIVKDINFTDSGDLEVKADSLGELVYLGNLDQLRDQIRNSKFEIRNSGELVSRIGGFAELVVGRIRVGFIETQNLIVKQIVADSIASLQIYTDKLVTNSLSVATENISVGGQVLKDYIVGVVNDAINNKQLAISNSQLVSPIAETEIVRTNLISPLAQDSDISMSLGNSKFEIRNSKLASGSAVATIDSSGNANFEGDIRAKSLEVSNDASIAGRLSSQSLSSNQLTTGDASISGTLRAKNIIADTIEGLEARIATIAANFIKPATSDWQLATSSGIPSNYTLDTSQLNAINISTFSSQLAYVENLSAANATFTQGLMSFGPTSLSDVSVIGQLAIGGNLILADSSINVFGADFEIQPLRQGGVSFLSGLFRIDTDGNLKVEGNAEFEKDVSVKGRLAANIISPLAQDSDISMSLGNSKFEIRNSKLATGSAVLAVNPKGDIVASGSGTFNKLNFSLVEPALALSDTEAIATGSAGTANLKRYKNELTINNPLVTEKSLIYITPTGDTGGAVLYLLRQEPDVSFTVGTSKIINTEIPFNWMIVN